MRMRVIDTFEWIFFCFMILRTAHNITHHCILLYIVIYVSGCSWFAFIFVRETKFDGFSHTTTAIIFFFVFSILNVQFWQFVKTNPIGLQPQTITFIRLRTFMRNMFDLLSVRATCFHMEATVELSTETNSNEISKRHHMTCSILL